MRQTKQEKALDKAIEAAYYKHCQGTTISIMDIPRLFADVRREVSGKVFLSPADLDTPVIAAIARYNQTKVG